MTNNFDIIEKILDFSDKDDYYYLQILKRRKENPEMKKDMRVLKDIFIFSLDDFHFKTESIIKLCDDENARAYFRINKRNAQKTALEALILMASYIASGDYKSVRNVFTKAAGRHHSDPDKKWILDIDWVDVPVGLKNWEYVDLISDAVTELITETGRDPGLLEIPTKNGLHIICRPFNLKKLRDAGFHLDIHKDNPTLLYCA